MAAGVGDRMGKDLVLCPLNTVVTHVPIAGPLAKGVATKIIIPGSQLAIHGIVGADNLAGHAVSSGEKVVTVSLAIGKPVISGVGWVADNVGMKVIDLRFATAQTKLMEANQMEKAGRIMTEVQVAGGFASQTMDDIGNARLGHAVQDLTELVISGLADVSKGRIQQTETVFSNTRSALAANLEAIGCMRQGQWTQATVAMGRGMAAAGNIVTLAGHTEMGVAIVQGGQAIEAEAPYVGHVVQVLSHVKVYRASSIDLENHPDPKKTALVLSQAAVASAKAGKFQEALLQATMVVALISGTKTVPNGQVTDAAILSAQTALAAMKDGRPCLADGKAADALGAAGKLIGESDPQTGRELINAAVNLHSYMNGTQSDIARAQQ
jgi:hypothetical protein